MILTDQTKVQLGLAVTLAGVIIAGTWWCATISAKVDSLISMSSASTNAFESIRKDADDLKIRVVILENKIGAR